MEVSPWCSLGHVVKRHGIKGCVKIHFDIPLPEQANVLYLGTADPADSPPVPFFVERKSEAHNITIVKFEDVDTPEQAAELIRQTVYLPAETCRDLLPSHPSLGMRRQETNPERVEETVIRGYDVRHRAEHIGYVKTIAPYPRNPMLIVKGSKKDILIPFNDHFVEKIDHENREIITVLPDGLLAL